MSDGFEWWRAALAGNRGPIHDGDPQPGFYRQKRRDGSFEPVAYWKDSATGEMRCHVNGRQPDDLRMMELWPYASKYPISEAAYWHRMDTGEWGDIDAGAAQVAKGPALDPQADPVASYKAEIDAARAGLDAYKKITSDESSARAQTLRSTLTTLAGKGKKAHKAEKEPFLEGGRAVDAKWFPPIREAEDAANAIRTAMEAWEDEKRAAARQAEREAEETLRAAQAATAAEDAANAGGNAPPVIETRAPTPAPATQIRGGSGRAASVGTKTVLKSIDLMKCWDKLGAQPEVYSLFMELAEKAIAAGKFSAADLGAVFEEKASIR